MPQLFNIYYTLFVSDGREKHHAEYATSKAIGQLHFNSGVKDESSCQECFSNSYQKILCLYDRQTVKNCDVYDRRTWQNAYKY